LINGRIDVVIDDIAVVGGYLAKTGNTDKVKLAGTPGEPTGLYIAFAPNNPKSEEYAKLISDGMATLRASGELTKILAKYGMSDWK